MWLKVLEVYAVQALLRSEAFHGMVRRVHGGVQELRHGGYGKHFIGEVKEQAGISAKKQGRSGTQQLNDRTTPPAQSKPVHEEEELHRPSFLREFIAEIKKNAGRGNR